MQDLHACTPLHALLCCIDTGAPCINYFCIVSCMMLYSLCMQCLAYIAVYTGDLFGSSCSALHILIMYTAAGLFGAVWLYCMGYVLEGIQGMSMNLHWSVTPGRGMGRPGLI